jgi:hypothetical protein
VAASIGAVWGAFGYALLWGHLPVVTNRRFVVSPLGTLVLLPVRAVLRTIRFVEDHVVGRPLELAESNWWIGLLAAALGAAIAAAALVLARLAVRRVRSA